MVTIRNSTISLYAATKALEVYYIICSLVSLNYIHWYQHHRIFQKFTAWKVLSKKKACVHIYTQHNLHACLRWCKRFLQSDWSAGFQWTGAPSVLRVYTALVAIHSSCVHMSIAHLWIQARVAYELLTTCMYMQTQHSQVVYFKAVKKGWAKNYYYGDVVVYALSTALLFHTVCAS